jgi:DNA-binding MarR family transcriptional regulator
MASVPAPVAPSAVQASTDIRVVVSRLRRRLRTVAETDDLTPSQVSVLTRLSKGEADSASALAASEGVRPQSMAATLAALQRQGLISRSPDATDGRRQVITVTDAGRQREQGNRQARQEWLTRAIHETFTEDERQTLIEAMALLERLTSR